MPRLFKLIYQIGLRSYVVGSIPLISNLNCFNDSAEVHTFNAVPVKTSFYLGRDYQNQQSKLLTQNPHFIYKNVVNTLQYYVNLAFRIFYLAYCLSPALTLAPFTFLISTNENIQSYWWDLFLTSLSQSGPCLTKFAQWASTRPDLFPLELCNRLKKLQHETNCHNQTEAMDIIRSKRWDVQMESGNSQPVILGSGCVAQVIKGYIIDETKPRPVAIKVINPNVKLSIETDLEILRIFCNALEIFPRMRMFSLSESVEEFSKLMIMQLDLRNEAKNLVTLRENFRKKGSLLDGLLRLIGGKESIESCTFPEPVYPYVSSNVLVESFEEGTLMSDILRMKDKDVNKKLGQIGLHAILKMVFEDNFIHADLHPGNIIVRKVGHDYQLCMIDAGIVTSLDDEDRKNFVDVFHAIVTNQGFRVGELFVERSKSANENVDKIGFSKDLAVMVNEVHQHGLALHHIGIGTLLQRLLVSCYVHHVKLEPKFSSILIAIGVLEGLGRRLDEDIDLLTSAIPYVLKATIKQNNSEK